MIATHNVKVNGRWYAAGEEIPEVKQPKAAKAPEAERAVPKAAESKADEPKAKEPEPAPEAVAELKTEAPKTTQRRKR